MSCGLGSVADSSTAVVRAGPQKHTLWADISHVLWGLGETVKRTAPLEVLEPQEAGQ